MTLKITLTLEESDLEHFRRALEDSRATLAKVGEETILKSAEELIQRLRARPRPEFVEERIGQLELFIEMARDERWRMPDEVRAHVLTALAYFGDPNDIIPDDVPGIGFVDDAILVELVLREMKHEIEAYREFCSFGYIDKEGGNKGPIDEESFRQRREELRKRIRRRARRDRERATSRGWRATLW